MRTVLITGASSGIGLPLCRRYLEAGWHILGHYRTMRPGFEALLRDAGSALTPWQCDFGDTQALETALTAEAERFAAVDALVSLAAEQQPRRFDQIAAADILRSMSVNLVPGLLLMRTVTPGMTARGWGRIVHGSSIGVRFGGGPESFCYSLAKHSMEFMPSAHKSWAKAGVLVNAVRIGVTDTRFHAKAAPDKNMEARTALIPMGRMAAPEEIAETLFWLGSEHNTYITGQTIACAGGE